MSITEDQAQSLTLVLAQMRPDWNPRGILTLIERNRDAHEFPALARAAVNAATNPTIRTPAVIFMPGAHWADPNTMNSSQRRMLQGLEFIQGAKDKPQGMQVSPWDRKGPHDRAEYDRVMNELQADNPEFKPRFIPPPHAQELEAADQTTHAEPDLPALEAAHDHQETTA